MQSVSIADHAPWYSTLTRGAMEDARSRQPRMDVRWL